MRWRHSPRTLNVTLTLSRCDVESMTSHDVESMTLTALQWSVKLRPISDELRRTWPRDALTTITSNDDVVSVVTWASWRDMTSWHERHGVVSVVRLYCGSGLPSALHRNSSPAYITDDVITSDVTSPTLTNVTSRTASSNISNLAHQLISAGHDRLPVTWHRTHSYLKVKGKGMSFVYSASSELLHFWSAQHGSQAFTV